MKYLHSPKLYRARIGLRHIYLLSIYSFLRTISNYTRIIVDFNLLPAFLNLFFKEQFAQLIRICKVVFNLDHYTSKFTNFVEVAISNNFVTVIS